MDNLLARSKMQTHLIAANNLALVLRDIPRENRRAQEAILYTLMILLDEDRQLAGADHAEVGQV